MNISKKMMRALTVAAIAGTCALSTPALANFQAANPENTSANLKTVTVTSATDANLVTAGQSGMVYYGKTTAESVELKKISEEVGEDIVDSIAINDNFVGITASGKFIYSLKGVYHTFDGPAEALSGKIVGIASVYTRPDDYMYAVTDKGELLQIDTVNEEWSVLDNNLSETAMAQADDVKGIFTDGTNFYAYGHVTGTEAANIFKLNVIKVPAEKTENVEISENAGPDKTVVAFNLSSCPNINDMKANSATEWVAVGSKIISGTSDLSTATAGDISGTVIAADVSDPLISVDYDFTTKHGFAASKHKVLEFDSAKVVNTQETQLTNINDVAMTVGASSPTVYKSYLACDGGKFLTSSDSSSYWTDFTNEDLTAPSAILSDGQSYYAVQPVADPASVKVLKFDNSVTAKTFTVNDSSTAIVNNRLLDNSANIYFATATNVYKAAKNDSANSDIAGADPAIADAKDIAVMGEDIFVLSSGNKITYLDSNLSSPVTRTLPTDSPTMTSIAASTAASTYGLYGIDSSGVLNVLTKEGNVVNSSNQMTEDSGFTACTDSEDHSITFGNSAKLYHLHDGSFAVADGTKIYKVYYHEFNSQDHYTKTELTGWGELAPGNITYITGDENGISAIDASGSVFVYDILTNKWQKYEGFTADEIASSGKTVLAIENGSSASARISSGSTYSPTDLTESGLPARAVQAVYAATTTTVYAGGAEGLMSVGTVNSADKTIAWKASTGIDAHADIKGITGVGETAFAWAQDYTSTENTVKLLIYTTKDGKTFTPATVAGLNPVETTQNNVTTSTTRIDRMIASSETEAYAIRGNTLYKVVIKGGEATFTVQKIGEAAIDTINHIAVSSDGKTIYGIKTDTDQGETLTLTSGNTWTSELTTEKVTGKNGVSLAGNIHIINDVPYMVTTNGIYSFSGKTLTKVYDGFDFGEWVEDSWCDANTIFIVDNENSADKSSTVFSYNVDTKETSTEVVGSNLDKIVGSTKGKYLIVSGGKNLQIDTLATGGSGTKETPVEPSSYNSDVVVTAENPVSMDANSLHKKYATSETMKVVTPVEEFEATIPDASYKASSAYVFDFHFTPAADVAVNNLSLVKLYDNKANENYTFRNSVPSKDAVSDGDYWITEFGTGNTKALVNGDVLKAGTTYQVNFAIQDNQKFDSNSDSKKIHDPVALVSASSDSSSSGCVFNPSQGFGLEWLLLMFAPLVATFRNRFKK